MAISHAERWWERKLIFRIQILMKSLERMTIIGVMPATSNASVETDTQMCSIEHIEGPILRY